MIVCSDCGRVIDPQKKRKDGLPDGVGFVLENGKVVNVCTECIAEVGKEKEGGENDGDNHNGDNLRNACNAGSDRQREKEEVTDELYGIHDFIVDMLCGSDLTAEERNTVERIRQRVLDGIRNISKR